jgi:hypothetical protein
VINIPVKATYDFFKSVTTVDYEAAQRQATIDTHLLQDFIGVARSVDARIKQGRPADPYEAILISVYKAVFDDKEKHVYIQEIIQDVGRRAEFNAALRDLTVIDRNILIVQAIDHVRRLKIGLRPFDADSV